MNGVVTAARAVGPRGRMLTVAVPDPLRAAHVACGQYCELAYQGETGFFAIARRPGPGPLEFYLQDGGGVSTPLMTAPVGARVRVTEPAGAGFGVDPATQPLVVVATGSGVAAVRGVWQAFSVAAVRVGFRRAEDLLFGDELAGLAAGGTQVVVALSRAVGGPLPAGLRAVRGYVQDTLTDAPRGGQVVVCGRAEMQAAVAAVAGPRPVLTNY